MKLSILPLLVLTLTLRLSAEEPAPRRVEVVANIEPLTAEQFAAHDFDPSQSAGLFVGVRRFAERQGSRLQNVPYAVDDAVDLAHFFVFEAELLLAENATVALAGEPQKEQSKARLEALVAGGARRVDATLTTIYATLGDARKSAGPRGLFLLTLATHGYTLSGNHHLLAQDSVLDFLDRTGLPVEELIDYVAASKAPRQLVLIDACREHVSGRRAIGQDPNSALSPRFARAIGAARGMAVLCATTAGGYSYDDDERKNGVFTATLLEGLRGAAPHDGQGFITPNTLAPFIDRRVRQWVSEHRAGDRLSRGIHYNTDDLRSGNLPLGSRRHALEAKERHLAVAREMIGDATTLAAIAWAFDELSSDALGPLAVRLEKLETLGRDYAPAFALWWRERGHAYTPLEVEMRVLASDGETPTDERAFAADETFTLALAASVRCYGTILRLGSDGAGELLFPVRELRSARVAIAVAPPPGEDRYIAIVARAPLRVEGMDAKALTRARPTPPAAVLPKGAQTRFGFARRSGPPRWQSLAQLLESVSPQSSAAAAITITVTTSPEGTR